MKLITGPHRQWQCDCGCLARLAIHQLGQWSPVGEHRQLLDGSGALPREVGMPGTSLEINYGKDFLRGVSNLSGFTGVF